MQTEEDELDRCLPHLVLLEVVKGKWRIAGTSFAEELPSDPFAAEALVAADDSYIRGTELERILASEFQTAEFRLTVPHRRFYCCSMPGTMTQRSIVLVSDRPVIGFSKHRLRRAALSISRYYIAHLVERRALLLEKIAHFSTTYFRGQFEVEPMLRAAAELIDCRALSLWLYNKHSECFTLYGSHGIDRDLYRRDWFSQKHRSLISSLTRRQNDVIPFRPKPRKSANPDVARLFQHGHLCQLRSQESSSLLGVLNVYDPVDSLLLQQDVLLRLVAAGVREHLLEFRAVNRNIGIRLAADCLSEAATALFEETLDSLCVNIVKRLHISGCSIFLARDKAASGIDLVSTSDTKYPEFAQRRPEEWRRSISYARGQGLTGGVLESARTRIVYDMPAHENENSHTYDELPPGSRKCWIGVPVFCPKHDVAIGVVRAFNKMIVRNDVQVPWHFQGSDVETLTNLATIIGYLWHNQQLQSESERRLTEAQHERDQKSRFLDSLGHEIIAPLQPLKNLINMLKNDPSIKGASNRRLPYFIEAAACQCGQMEMTVTNIASLDEPATAKPDFVDLVDDIVHPVVDLFRLQAKVDKDVEIYFDEDLRRLPEAFVDPRLARQILFALMHNAFKYCDDHSTIYVTGEMDEYGDYINVFVEDTGLPIPKDWEDKVFNRGIRAPNVAEQLLPGSGLGLTIARQLATICGTQIWITRSESPVRIGFAVPLSK